QLVNGEVCVPAIFHEVFLNNQKFDQLDKSKGDNYLSHQDSFQYNLLVNALFDCGSGKDCSTYDIAKMQQEASRLLKKDRDADARLRVACQIASSDVCRSEINSLKKAFNSYKNLPDIQDTVTDGTFTDFLEVSTLYGEHQRQTMSDNAKRALVSIPIDTVTGAVDLSIVTTKALAGDQEAQHQLSAIGKGIQEFITNPVDTVARNIKEQLDEADRQEALGNINRAQEIRSKIIIEGAFAVTVSVSGAFSLVRTGTGISKQNNIATQLDEMGKKGRADNGTNYTEIVGLGADAAHADLPAQYTRVVTQGGEIVIRGPRKGIYEQTDFVDAAGNLLYKNNNKLYSLYLEKESVRVQDAFKITSEVSSMPSGNFNSLDFRRLNDAIVGLISGIKENEIKYANEIARTSTNVSKDDSRVVLGQWKESGGYIEEARENGGIWFETPPEFFGVLSSSLDKSKLVKKAWVVNEKFLEQQLINGVPKFELHGETIENVLLNRPDSFTAREIKYLEKNAKNYGYKREDNSWIKVND
ncbi:MAG: hypothetical protein HKN34_11350, partial [Gammaproteobacteria bacterium]|nr:hypothetical protein [Gammaproteobacteria bacterium]